MLPTLLLFEGYHSALASSVFCFLLTFEEIEVDLTEAGGTYLAVAEVGKLCVATSSFADNESGSLAEL